MAKHMPKDCQDCKHHTIHDAPGNTRLICGLEHKPRFYKPLDGNVWRAWGWLRRCDDFEAANA